MSSTSERTRLASLALLAATWVGPYAAAQGTQAGDPDDYGAGDFGRIRSADRGVTILRSESGERAAPNDDVNAPIFPADVLTTDSRQRVEVQLARGSLVRLDYDSEIAFLAMPDPYAEIADHTVLRLTQGAIRVTSAGGKDDEFRVDTPAATIYLVGEVDLRIDVERSGRTVVSSHRGVAEVVGGTGSAILRAGESSDVDPGSQPRDPSPFSTFRADRFDGWVAERDAVYQVQSRDKAVYDSLPAPVRSYYGELSANGSWVQTDEFGYVWVPGGVGDDWRPYYRGSWAYGPYGYFWVGAEPWGWAPYHYGRWNYVGPHGWCWIPGAAFAGAWVSWSFGDVYVGWGPLDYWNGPAWYSTVYLGYYDPFAWTFVPYRYFGYPHCGTYGAPWHVVGDGLHRAAIVTRPPRVAPSRLAGSLETREQAVQQLRTDGTERPRAAATRRQPVSSFRAAENETPQRAAASRSARTETASRTAPAPGHVRRLTTREAAAPRTRSSATEATLPSRSSAPRVVETGQTGQSRVSRPAAPSRSATPAPTSAQAAPEPQVRRTTVVPGSAPRQIAPRSTAEPLRDVYRKMAQPRTTRPQAPSAPPAARTGETAAAPRGAEAAPQSPPTQAVPKRVAPGRAPSAGRAVPSRRPSGAAPRQAPAPSSGGKGRPAARRR